ncbi:hypothetical protein SAMN05660772_01563 [Pasteurella testudinis DSM 23072]|uniref:Uncharacterized protein n=1 Tax=Pasteurella testudinis DSM 23072 TaxID=1122938 RepID=A0A1W1VAU7_9PAST|nr:hypothetical protein SAMN05660772_01563 [Pasteurella testudinis DSM 23072]SUB52835.1 Uncharacterised protein [Pasteurella testudinis]
MQTRSFDNNRSFCFGKTVMRSLRSLPPLFSFDQQSSVNGDFFCPQFTPLTSRTIRFIPILIPNSRSNRNATRSYF